ncbi:unnamed protein product [Polarella glacialis]|uniref:Uncharacterized protein n=1 Tax=Polarella glacialis TaxID=89957 RepID=A0A813JKF3_POLGL|nr:unnamed protein product [Polarella glacialis]
MEFSRIKAKESLDLNFVKWLRINDAKQTKDKYLVAKSKTLADLNSIGGHLSHSFHFNRGDPYGDTMRDKSLMMEKGGGAPSPTAERREVDANLTAVPPVKVVGSFDHLHGAALHRPASLQKKPLTLYGPVPLPFLVRSSSNPVIRETYDMQPRGFFPFRREDTMKATSSSASPKSRDEGDGPRASELAEELSVASPSGRSVSSFLRRAEPLEEFETGDTLSSWQYPGRPLLQTAIKSQGSPKFQGCRFQSSFSLG